MMCYIVYMYKFKLLGIVSYQISMTWKIYVNTFMDVI